jgi:hypothetical protein
MEDLSLTRQSRAERALPEPQARADAWRVLDARIAAEATSASFVDGAESRAAARPRRWGFARRHRRVLSFAGATAVAAVLAGAIVLSSGPTATPAAAAVLRETAAVARQAAGPSGAPGPGHFFFLKQEERSLEEWAPGSYTGSYGGIRPKAKDAIGAFVTSVQESWRSTDATSRTRWRMEPLEFLTPADKQRWEAEGKPLPGPFAGEAGTAGLKDAHLIAARRGLWDVEAKEGGGFIDSSVYPTDPKALRQGLEHHTIKGAREWDGVKGPLTVDETIAELWDILEKPNTTPPVRAAVYGALAELPGIQVKEDVSDLVGRHGDAIFLEDKGRGSFLGAEAGMRVEFIFDPQTSALLGERETLVDPSKRPWLKGVPVGTVLRELALINSGIVDSTHERPGADRGGTQAKGE